MTKSKDKLELFSLDSDVDDLIKSGKFYILKPVDHNVNTWSYHNTLYAAWYMVKYSIPLPLYARRIGVSTRGLRKVIKTGIFKMAQARNALPFAGGIYKHTLMETYDALEKKNVQPTPHNADSHPESWSDSQLLYVVDALVHNEDDIPCYNDTLLLVPVSFARRVIQFLTENQLALSNKFGAVKSIEQNGTSTPTECDAVSSSRLKPIKVGSLYTVEYMTLKWKIRVNPDFIDIWSENTILNIPHSKFKDYTWSIVRLGESCYVRPSIPSTPAIKFTTPKGGQYTALDAALSLTETLKTIATSSTHTNS